MVQAVIFDLFGTLTGFESARGSHAAVLAEVLGVPVEALTEQFRETYDERARGVFGDVREQLVHVAERLGAPPSDAVLERATELRMEGQRVVLQPRPGAIDVLTQLRARGLKLGVLSDCTNEIPILWPTSPYAELIDVAVFSCSLGIRKPDPRTYSAVLDALMVSADRCIYVGDGGSSELSGAKAVGLRPILLRIDEENHYRPEAETGWVGESIESLAQVLDLLDG
jgi:putative hydrolase of the HAD superfamily